LLIQQVLTNLVENSIKYTPARSPIEITACAGSNEVTVAVADRGAGLKPEDQERVFEKFFRSSGNGSTSGVGLGLAICKGIVELHGGRIRAENRADGGAIFSFTLPLGKPPTEKNHSVVENVAR
jgi:two-component system sensor histidine kinase KdpD